MRRFLDVGHAAQGGGVPELVDVGAAFDQAAGDVPAAVADRVVQWGADRPAGCFEVGAGGDEGVGDVEVVAAGRPVQRRFRCPAPPVSALGSAPAATSIRTTAGPPG